MYQIYILQFESGHYYIGRSSEYRKRYTVHKRLLRKGIHPNKYMQRVYKQYELLPRCILLMHCLNCLAVEQVLISYHHGKDNCLNLSSNSTGGDGRNSTPPLVTRDDLKVCNIKTKDFSNLSKLLRMLPVEKVASYYKVHFSTIYRLCKKLKLPYIRNSPKKRGHLGYLKLLETQVPEFIMDAHKLSLSDLANKYKVSKHTICYWKNIYQTYKNIIIRPSAAGEVKLSDLVRTL